MSGAVVRHGRSAEPGNGSRPAKSAEVEALLADLKANTDLAWLVERVVRYSLPWVVVPGAAQDAWAARDPVGWKRVRAWLEANGIAVIRI